jgi:hypothetical protein
MNVSQRMMLENTNQGGALHMEREATGAIAVQLKSKSEIQALLYAFKAGSSIEIGQLNTQKR